MLFTWNIKIERSDDVKRAIDIIRKQYMDLPPARRPAATIIDPVGIGEYAVGVLSHRGLPVRKGNFAFEQTNE